MIFITFIIITGVIISIDISIIETEAFYDNQDLKQINEKDDGKINYQQMYKQYDFAKYLNHYYTYSKEDSKNYDSPEGVENSEVNSFSITSNNLNDKDGDNKKQQKQE
jgi:K+-transporting ATPase c subunit